MRFSWINTIITVYFISILLYAFVDNSTFWNSFFWIDTSLICIAGWAFNFIKRKTILELSFILFVVFLKVFNIVYYVIGLILDSPDNKWMNTHIYFLVEMAISGFIGMIFYANKYEKENNTICS